MLYPTILSRKAPHPSRFASHLTNYGIAATGSYTRLDSLRDAPPRGGRFLRLLHVFCSSLIFYKNCLTNAVIKPIISTMGANGARIVPRRFQCMQNAGKAAFMIPQIEKRMDQIMYKIVRKKELNDSVTLMEIEAPFVAKKAKAGQFIIFRIDEKSERVPLTIAGYDREKGTVSIIFQKVGFSTKALGALNEGDYIRDFVGPLGKPTDVEGKKRVCVVGGGVGCAIALPAAVAFKEAGAEVDVIIGFRNKDIVILEDEFRACADHLYLMTDDGSYGEKGFGTVKLQALLESGVQYDEVLAIGPVPMMKFVCKTTEPFGVHTMVSLNPIMVDGTGMCGGCRVTVGGETKFACVDGPEFDGHKVDYEELMSRNGTYREREAEVARDHVCRMETMGKALIK